MSAQNAVAAVYENHTGAEAAVKELQRSGFDMEKLSIVGKNYHTEEDVDPTRIRSSDRRIPSGESARGRNLPVPCGCRQQGGRIRQHHGNRCPLSQGVV